MSSRGTDSGEMWWGKKKQDDLLLRRRQLIESWFAWFKCRGVDPPRNAFRCGRSVTLESGVAADVVRDRRSCEENAQAASSDVTTEGRPSGLISRASCPLMTDRACCAILALARFAFSIAGSLPSISSVCNPSLSK